MTIEFNCPTCQKLLRTADGKAGASATCPGCGGRVWVPRSTPDADTTPTPSETFDDDFGSRYDSPGATGESAAPAETATKPCPMCGEEIQTAAVTCRYCGESIGRQPVVPYAPAANNGMAVAALVLGIVSLVMLGCFACASLPFSIAAVVVGGIAVTQCNRGLADGKGLAVAGIVCGTVPIVLSIIGVVFFVFMGMAGQF